MPPPPPDMDTHVGTRVAAMKLLEQCGVVSGVGAMPRDKLQRAVDSVELSGPREPIVPSPFKITEFVAGAHAAMGALAALLAKESGRRVDVNFDVSHAAAVLFAPFALEWLVENGGTWPEINLILNARLMESMGAPAVASVVPGEILQDPPEGTPPISPLFTQFRFFLSHVYKTRDRHLFLFPRLTDDPRAYLRALNLPEETIAHLIRLAITGPQTHPTKYLAYHSEFLAILKSHLESQSALDLESNIKKINAIAVVPLTRSEFSKTEQGLALSRVPRVSIERTGSIAPPRPLSAWSNPVEDNGALWPERGFPYGPTKPSMRTRGPLYGLKVLEVVRMVAGPMIGLQLAALGADVLRVNSRDIVDYPAYDFVGPRFVLYRGLRAEGADVFCGAAGLGNEFEQEDRRARSQVGRGEGEIEGVDTRSGRDHREPSRRKHGETRVRVRGCVEDNRETGESKFPVPFS